MNKRMKENRVYVGVYCFAGKAHSEDKIAELKESGVDFVIDFPTSHLIKKKNLLDCFNKYGVGIIAGGVLPLWMGGFGEFAGKMHTLPETSIEVYDKVSPDFIDHPAIWGLDVGDEPSAADFGHYKKIFERVNKLYPNQFPYVDLYPNYAVVAENNTNQKYSQLGTKTYKEYIQKYCETIDTFYIAYDFYMYSSTVGGGLDNLEVVADACRGSGRELWITLQVNSSPAHENEIISTNQMRFQAYSALCFGARVIIWACYSEGAWWAHNILDINGEKTSQYDKMKLVNAEIKTLTAEYSDFTNVNTHFVGFKDSPLVETLSAKPVDELNTGAFSGLKAENGENLIVGQMVSKNGDGAAALMICAADDVMDNGGKKFKVSFSAGVRDAQAINSDGLNPLVKNEDGTYTFEIESNKAVFIVAR